MTRSKIKVVLGLCLPNLVSGHFVDSMYDLLASANNLHGCQLLIIEIEEAELISGQKKSVQSHVTKRIEKYILMKLVEKFYRIFFYLDNI